MVFRKYESMEDVWDRALKGRGAIGAVESYESKKCEHVGKEGLRSIIMLPTLSFVSET